MIEKPTINVACAIIVRDNKILATQRSEKMSLPLKWEFPGGKIDTNESAEDCIHRELKEELNITVRIMQRLNDYPHSYGNIIVNLIPFIAEYIGGEIFLAEHKDMKWLHVNDLPTLEWAAADVPIVNYLINN